MITIKCMGKTNDTIVVNLNQENIESLEDLLTFLSNQNEIKDTPFELKYKGKTISSEFVLEDGMKFICILQSKKVKPAAPPPPSTQRIPSNNNSSESNKFKCKGYNRVCSFFSSVDTEGYCSLCYKRRLNAKRTKAHLAPPPEEAILQTDETRCWICSKRIGLLGFSCKCGYKFCGLHRYPEQHTCTFNHKSDKLQHLNDKLNAYAINKRKIDKL